MAKDVSLKISASVDQAEQQIRKLQATGQAVTSVLEQSFQQLGINSSVAVDAQQTAYTSAYERIRDSGVATWDEIQQAHAAMTAKISALGGALDPVSAKLAQVDGQILAMMESGESSVDRLAVAFQQLGVRTTAAIEEERAATVAAYQQIAQSGVATWQEIQTAHAAMVAKTSALDLEAQFGPGAKAAKTLGQNIEDIGSSVDKLTPRFAGLIVTLGAFYVGSKLWQGFEYGIKAVDDFQQSVIKTAAMITSLETGGDLASNYKQAKEYASGLNDVLMQVDARTTLNLQSLQVITEEMVKQGVVLDYTNKEQVEGFTRLANAVAVYSRNGADERQVRQETQALLMGQVNQNSQLASMLQRTVDGPLKTQVDLWKQSGTLVQEIGAHLKGFGPASEDLNTSWSAVKTSLETAVSLVARAGFTDIVKDIAGWLGTINDYLKEHREEIGGEIKSGWEELKGLMSDAMTIAKAIYDNFEPLAVLFIGGALFAGVTKIVNLFTTMRDLAVSTRAAMVGLGMITAGEGAVGAAGAATAGGAVAGAGVGAVAGGGLLGSLLAGGGALLGGLGLGYALQPVVRWADKSLYNNFGVNLTGEAMYDQEMQRNAQSTTAYNAMLANKAAANAPSPIPKINMGPTPAQIAADIALQEKEVAAFKANQEAMSASAKEQAAIRLSILKASYDTGEISAQDYYRADQQAALDAAQAKFQTTSDYLNKEQQLLDSIAEKKGASSPEYMQELAKNKKAISDMQTAELDYAKTYLDSEAKMTAALRAREDEYAKYQQQYLQDSGQYVAAEEAKQAQDEKSIDYLRLKKEAEEGVQGAVQALWDIEKKRAEDLVAAKNKEHQQALQYQNDIAKMRDQVDALNGKDQELIKSESDLRDGVTKEAQLRDQLSLAWAQGNMTAIKGLSTEIQLQQQLNSELQANLNFLEQQKVLSGQIVGFNNGVPIFSSAGGSFNNGQAVSPYQQAYTIQSSFTSTSLSNLPSPYESSPFVGLNDPFSSLPSFDVGTPFVSRDMIAKIHYGERIVTAKDNAAGNYGGITVHPGGIQISVAGGGDSAATVDAIARQLLPKLDELSRRRRAA